MPFTPHVNYPVLLDLKYRIARTANAQQKYNVAAASIDFPMCHDGFCTNGHNEYPTIQVMRNADNQVVATFVGSTYNALSRCFPNQITLRGDYLNALFDALQNRAADYTITTTVRARYAGLFWRYLKWHGATDAEEGANVTLATAGNVEVEALAQEVGIHRGEHPPGRTANAPGDLRNAGHQYYSNRVADIPTATTACQELVNFGVVVGARISFLLDLSGQPAADQKRVARFFVAADYTKLLFAGGDPEHDTWFANVSNFIRCYADIDRGQAVFNALVTECIGHYTGGANTQQTLIPRVEESLRRRIIPANFWTGIRRSQVNRPNQYTLKEIVGAIHNRYWIASPVNQIRSVQRALTGPQTTFLVLQMGMGHCGEHASLSFHVVQAMMQRNGNIAILLGTIVTGGYANIDHCWCAGGYEPARLIKIGTPMPGKLHEKIEVWNINTGYNFTSSTRDNTRRVPTRTGTYDDGFIVDPYFERVPEEDEHPGVSVYDRCIGGSGYHRHSQRHPAPVVAEVNNADPDVNRLRQRPNWWPAAFPVITALDHTAGSTAGGLNITITGTDFDANPLVFFRAPGVADAAGANVVRVNGTTITVDTPPHAAGATTVVVRNTDTQEGTRNNGFTFAVPPNVTGLAPATVSTAGGTPVQINGNGFVNGATADLGGGHQATVFVSANQLTTNAPAHLAGAVNVVVRNPVGLAGATSQLTYVAPPNVTGIVPGVVSTAGGTPVQINGNGFANGATADLGNGQQAVVWANAGQMNGGTPPHAAGVVNVVARNPDGVTGGTAALTYANPPAVVNVMPAAGHPQGGYQVTVNGNHFAVGATVTFGGQAAVVNNVLANALTVTVPQGGVGRVLVVVTNANGLQGQLAGGFRYQEKRPR